MSTNKDLQRYKYDGNFMTSASSSSSSSRSYKQRTNTRHNTRKWRLAYKDFCSTGGDALIYQCLIDKANEWLKKSTEIRVKSCETITWSSRDAKRLGDSEEVVLTRGILENDSTHYMRGLRLWLVPQVGGKSQTIGYTDIIPERNDTIQDLVNRANEKITKNQLKGQIVSIETVPSPVVDNRVKTQQTRWTDGVNDEKLYAFSIRLYYTKSASPCNTHIGICDQIPRKCGSSYDGFSDLCNRANDWLKDQEGVRITNLQSLMVIKDEGPHEEIGSKCFFAMSGVQQSDGAVFSSESFRILRIAYLRITNGSSLQSFTLAPFSYETFTPEVITTRADLKPKERMEKMKETFTRMAAFLKNSPNVELINIETVVNPMMFAELDPNVSPDPSDSDDDEEMKFLLTLRVYMTGQMEDLEERRELIPISSRREKARDEPAGPLFLRNVVQRQYKYRWVVLFITISVCMAIIVVISVIYGNR